MEGQKHFGGTLKGEAGEQGDFPVLVRAKEWLNRYLLAKNFEYQLGNAISIIIPCHRVVGADGRWLYLENEESSNISL